MIFRAVSILLLTLPVVASAHHSRANFIQEVVTFEATVTRVEWANPHVYVYLEAPDQNGVMTEWVVETHSTPGLTRRGWTSDSLRAGDVVMISANPDRNPERKFLFGDTFTKEDGTILRVQGPSGRDAVDDVPSSDSLAGNWSSAGGGPGSRDGPVTDLPLTEKALAAVADFDASDNPMAQCIPGTPPGNMGGPYLHGIEIHDDVVILRNQARATRTVYMDTEHPSDIELTNQGHSIGRWEGDVLVVDTVAIAGHRWGTARGVPSGAERHVVERYTLSEDDKMVTIDYVVEDPEYLTEAISSTIRWNHTPHLEWVTYDCDPEVARRFLAED
jgi:hypothetical protein